MKRKLLIIFKLIVMCLILSACTSECDEVVMSTYFHNDSDVTVRVSIIDSNNTRSPYYLFPPGKGYIFDVASLTYTAEVNAYAEWMPVALAKRKKLISTLTTKALSSKEIDEIKTSLSELEAIIKTFRLSATTKSCQGYVNMGIPPSDDDYKPAYWNGISEIVVTNGEELHSIKVTCINNNH